MAGYPVKAWCPGQQRGPVRGLRTGPACASGLTSNLRAFSRRELLSPGLATLQPADLTPLDSSRVLGAGSLWLLGLPRGNVHNELRPLVGIAGPLGIRHHRFRAERLARIM